MDKATALRKIQKCLALSQSSEPHEAARAMQQAQALMRQFNVDHPELNAMGASSDWARSRAMRKPPTYEVMLAQVVSDAFGCELIWSGRWTSTGFAGGYTFIGAGASAQVATYSFTVLARKLRHARTEYTAKHLKRYRKNKVAAADSYCEGWVYGVSKAVLPNPPDEKARTAIAAYQSIHHPNISDKPLATNRRELADSNRADDHANSGERDGKKTALHQGVGASGQHTLALGQM